MRRFALLLLVAGACSRSSAGGDEADEEERPPVAVTCVAATQGAMADVAVMRGVVASPPEKDAIVASMTAGRITAVNVREGDVVKKGQLLAVVEDPSLASGVGEAEAAVATARAAEQSAKANLDRQKKLFADGVVAERRVEEAQATWAAAAAELRAAKAKEGLALAQKQRAHVAAPIAGTIVHLLRKTGELVDGTPQTPIAEIADPAQLELHADTSAADLVRLADGAAAEVRLDALPDTPLTGTIVNLAPAVDPVTSLGSVRIALQAPDPKVARLRLGLSGQARVKLAERQGVTIVPAAALRRSSEGKDEVVVCAGEKAEAREVVVGARSGDIIEIREGLKADEKVVVTHLIGLEDGAAIRVEGAGP